MITGVVLAPITGIFVLGIFRPTGQHLRSVGRYPPRPWWRITTRKFHLDLHAMVYLIVGVFTCLIVGWLASFLAPPPPQTKVHGLTIFTLKDAEGGINFYEKTN